MSLFKNWPKLPKTVDVSVWNKEKGVIAKMFKKNTGISEGIKSVDDANDKVQKAHFSDTWVQCEKCTEKELLEHYTEAEKEIGKSVKKLIIALNALADTAKKRAVDFKKMPLAPKSSHTYLGNLERECKLHTMAIDLFTKDCLKDMGEAMKKIKKGKK
jgi:hypothetical protein